MDWKVSYGLDIREIDDQHRELIRQFRGISELVQYRASWSDIHYRLVELRHFAEFHFRFEEALMRLFGYPEADAHAGSHATFFLKMDELQKTAITANVGEETIRFLYDWLTQHILGSDRAYAAHILSGAAIVRSEAA